MSFKALGPMIEIVATFIAQLAPGPSAGQRVSFDPDPNGLTQCQAHSPRSCFSNFLHTVHRAYTTSLSPLNGISSFAHGAWARTAHLGHFSPVEARTEDPEGRTALSTCCHF